MYINRNNVECISTEIQRDDKVITRISYKIKNHAIFVNDISTKDKIIFDIEETDSEVLFKFKYQNMDKLESILKPSTIACNRSPFSTKNLPKSDYKIPSEDLDIYSNIIKKIPKNELIKLVHISQEFMKKKAKTKKQITALYAEKKKLGMKPKEFCHYKGWWDEYVKYVKESI